MPMTTEELLELLKGEPSLPMLPQVIIKVQETIAENEASAKDLASTILEDQVLTARLLKLANSSFYHTQSKRITTVTDAIVLLGFKTVKNVTLGLSVYSLVSAFAKNKYFRDFWRQALCCAIAAKLLAKTCQHKVPEEAFVAGLLHNIGRLVLSQYCPKEYDDVVKAVKEGKNCARSEETLIGIDHHQAGKVMAQYWKLPDPLIETILYYDQAYPQGSLQDKPHYHEVVHIAHRLALNIYGLDAEKAANPISKIGRSCEKLLKISTDELFELAGRLSEKVYEVALILDFTIEGVKLKDSLPEVGEHPADYAVAKSNQLNLLMDLNRKLAEGEKLEVILNDAVDGLYQCLNLRRLFFVFMRPGGERLSAEFGYGGDSKELVRRLRVSTIEQEDVMVSASMNDESFNYTAYDSPPNQLGTQILFQALGTHRVAGFPVKMRNKRPGLMILQKKDDDLLLNDEEQAFVQSFCDFLQIAFKQIKKQS